MTFVPWPQGAKLALVYSGPQGEFANILALTNPDFDTADQLALVNLLMLNSVPTAYRLLLADSVSLLRMEITDMRTEGAPLVISTAPALDGIDDGEAVNASLCCLATLRTSKRGRSYRGRLYFGGFSETFLTEGLWTADVGAQVVAFIGLMHQYMLAEGWTHCVASEMHNHEVTSPADMVPVQQVVVRSLIPAHQRRRDRRP